MLRQLPNNGYDKNNRRKTKKKKRIFHGGAHYITLFTLFIHDSLHYPLGKWKIK